MEPIPPESQNQRGVWGKMPSFSFPASKFALWNPAPIGESTVSHLSYRNPKVIIAEKTLRLAHRHAKQSRKKPFTCFLVGTLAVDENGERVLLTVDRFDPGREEPNGLGKIPTAPLPGDFFIPCRIGAWECSSSDTIVHTFEDFNVAFKMLHQNLNSQDSLELSKLLTLRVHISSVENMDNLNFDFHWAAVTVANVLKFTPMKPIPIIPTALARNLSSNMSIAHIQGTYKYGYLSMDQTRKLLLILESDPKACTLPLIGIWLSGLVHIHNPQVSAFCLRYLYSSSIQERVFSETGRFLVVLFALNHKDPKFYECFPYDGRTELDFQLLTCKETLHLFKDVEPSDKYPIQFELNSQNINAETEFFSKISKNISINSLSLDCSPNKLSVSDHDSGVEDDASPRPFPRPHPINQKMTEIHPSVPELSIVLEGISTESVPTSKYALIKNQPSIVHQPAKMAYSVAHVPQHPRSSDAGRQIFTLDAREPPPKQIPSHLKHRIPSLKPCKGMQPPLQLQSSAAGSQAKKGCVAASPSISCNDIENTPLHQHGIPSERPLANSDDVPQKGELSTNGFSAQKSNQPPVVSQYPWHTCTLSPSYLRRPLGVRVPIQGPSCCSPCICNCQQYGPMQYSPANVWQGLCNDSPENRSGPTQESTKLMFHQNPECVNGGCNPVCATGSPVGIGHHGIIGNCSPVNNNTSTAVRMSSPINPGNTQSHTTHSACMYLPAANTVSDNEMVDLSSDVYRILAEQHRQIKLLQAQIQQLLEAQTVQSCASRSIENNSIQSEKQVEFVAMETQSSPGLHMKKSISIAVSTGASLFWNTPLEKKKESVKEDEVEISNEDITISMSAEKYSSQASIASSLKAVDIPSFVDSVHIVEGGTNQSSAGLCNGPLATGIDQASLQNENGNKCFQRSTVEGTDNNFEPTDKQNFECPITTPPNVSPDDQKIYHDILGQVNRFLKESSDESSPSLREDLIKDECTTSLKINKAQKRDSTSDMVLRDKDSVLTATLKQLRNLGVDFDSPKKMNNVHKVENAGVLACINPEAIVPGLNCISFANVGMSGLTPTGADLSMEANAIALKYLSENQLSQLSLSQSSHRSSVASSLQTLLQTNTEKSLMGLGLISPGNMSFATKRYMRRYGLLQSSDGSDDEEEQPSETYKRKERQEPVLHLDFNPVLEGFASWEGSPERTGEKQITLDPTHCETESSCHRLHSEGPVFRNVTNAVLPPRILHQINETPHPFLKDLKPKMKLLPGEAEFTRRPDKENLNVHIVTGTPQAPSVDNLNQAENFNLVGTFLDVKQLRQLPKLF
ncbi:SCL-interrupting locus protein [Protobothrops mucrosquamatus]|uniref:SCL-interrupting locus protein n=1 Tax=Protobothrops mucrosquamatus TaxID=103944 RepID=UPI000775B837|nr:SCL-interrupting locus protein [Protobothrops mucrosquamatus]